MITECQNPIIGSKKVEGIELPSGYNTYAARHWLSQDSEYVELVVRYDKSGNFKYLKVTENYKLTGEDYSNKSDEELKSLAKGECEESDIFDKKYDGYQVICTVENRIYKAGISFTDKSIDAGILNDHFSDHLLQEYIDEFDKFRTEEKAKEFFATVKDNLRASNGDFLMIQNEKVTLSN